MIEKGIQDDKIRIEEPVLCGRGGGSMATSSIFSNVKITAPKKVETFVEALDASARDPERRPTGSVIPLVNDIDEIRKFMAARVSKG